jgi:molybdopterin/thiamine biosynthesis adenylyltransferase
MRQEGIYDPSELQKSVEIVGCGGIGSFTADALVRLGIRNITIWDYDSVEEHNQPNQNFYPNELGLLKVEAIRKRWNGENVNIIIKNERWTPDKELSGDIIISAVDNIDTRWDIYEQIKNKNRYFVDGRIGGENFRVVTIYGLNKYQCIYWEKSILPKGSIVELPPCTERAIIYVGYMIAGWICYNVKRIIKGEKVKREIVVGLKEPTILMVE